MTYALKDIGEAIQKERERRGLSQRAYAALTGATQPRVSKIENGEIDPRVSTLIEFARSLDLDLMLVPRQHVPAVNAIISKKPRSSEERATQSALQRLNNNVIELQARFPDNEALTKLQQTVRSLSNFNLGGEDAMRITKIADAVKSIEDEPAAINSLKNHINQLRRIRNEVVHSISSDAGERRPAYRLDEADDE